MSGALEQVAKSASVMGNLMGGGGSDTRIQKDKQYRQSTMPHDINRWQDNVIGPTLGLFLGDDGRRKARESYQGILEKLGPWADRFNLTQGSSVRDAVRREVGRTSPNKHIDERAQWYAQKLMGESGDYLDPGTRAKVMQRLSRSGHIAPMGTASKRQAQGSMARMDKLEPLLEYFKAKGVAPERGVQQLAQKGLLNTMDFDSIKTHLKRKKLERDKYGV